MAVKSPWCLLFYRLNNSNSLILFSQESCSTPQSSSWSSLVYDGLIIKGWQADSRSIVKDYNEHSLLILTPHGSQHRDQHWLP